MTETCLQTRERPGAATPPSPSAHECWARAVEASAGGDDDLNVVIVTIARLIRLRRVDDGYAAARLVRSFKAGRGTALAAAIEAIGVALLSA